MSQGSSASTLLPLRTPQMRADALSQARRAGPRLLGGAVVVYAFLAATGLLLTRLLGHGKPLGFDADASQWVVRQRTPTLNTLTHFGSWMSETPTAFVLCAVLVLGLRWWLGRWRESLAILVSIMGELFIFLLVTSTVHRQRPAVPHLDPAPPTSSFPSGHVGAAVALYIGLAVVLLHATRSGGRRPRLRPVALAAAPLLCLVPLIVASSRFYRGMHYVTDVAAGALAGGLWMVIVMVTLLPGAGVGAQRQ
jgi:membrane-associated phospholipid phosphatase